MVLQSNTEHVYHRSPYFLRDIKIQALDRFGKRIGFMKMVANITNANGEFLPGATALAYSYHLRYTLRHYIYNTPQDLQSSSTRCKSECPRVASTTNLLTDIRQLKIEVEKMEKRVHCNKQKQEAILFRRTWITRVLEICKNRYEY